MEAAADFVAFGGWIGLSDFRNDFDTMAASNIIILLYYYIIIIVYIIFILFIIFFGAGRNLSPGI